MEPRSFCFLLLLLTVTVDAKTTTSIKDDDSRRKSCERGNTADCAQAPVPQIKDDAENKYCERGNAADCALKTADISKDDDMENRSCERGNDGDCGTKRNLFLPELNTTPQPPSQADQKEFDFRQEFLKEDGTLDHDSLDDFEKQFLREDGSLDYEGLQKALEDEDEKTTNSLTPAPPDTKRLPYSARLTLSVEGNLTGVHEENKEAQMRALQLFEAGQLALGEMGTGVLVEFDISSREQADEKLKKDLMFIDHAFDEYVSNLISLNRSLPDRRDPWCRTRAAVLHPVENLPATSIIICFCNEAWSTLVRSIYSILNRTPHRLIQEIILVDDASTMEHLGTRLDELVNKLPLVKIIRLRERQGLVRSRLAGIRQATAEILTFLDSHIEATDGWLEPLLDRVHQNPRAIACPVIEAIDFKTFQYKMVTANVIGTISWKLEFEWTRNIQSINSHRRHDWAPLNSAAMAGGLFSINKEWFTDLGLYDEGMEIWGGENIELSFRQWTCGGFIEIVPCSRVGHVYRDWSPYPWRSDINVLRYNPLRVAAVWMDEYKYLYYDRLGQWNEPLEKRLGDFGDVTSRIELRKKLKCNSFQWYLDNVARNLPQHKVLATGELFNLPTKQCLTMVDKTENFNKPIETSPCTMKAGTQYWLYRTDGLIVRDILCVGVQKNEVVLTACVADNSWRYDFETRHLMSKSGLCLTLKSPPEGLELRECRHGNPNQFWAFTHYNPGGMKYSDIAL